MIRRPTQLLPPLATLLPPVQTPFRPRCLHHPMTRSHLHLHRHLFPRPHTFLALPVRNRDPANRRRLPHLLFRVVNVRHLPRHLTPDSTEATVKTAKKGSTPPNTTPKAAFQSPQVSVPPPPGKPPAVPRMVAKLQTNDSFIPVPARHNNRTRHARSGSNSNTATSNRAPSGSSNPKSDFRMAKRD